MKNIFVSSESVDDIHVADLIHKLRDSAFNVDHSPRNPLDAKDDRWRDWYDKGLHTALDKSDIFICVITPSWDCSTWMAQEAHEAQRRMAQGQIRQCYYYNPEHIEAKAVGMLPYLQRQLPDDLHEVIQVLTGELIA